MNKEMVALTRNNLTVNDEANNYDRNLNSAAKISIIGAAISTFGDALQTVGGVLALEEAIADEEKDKQEKKEQNMLLESIQKQLDELTKEISVLKNKDNQSDYFN